MSNTFPYSSFGDNDADRRGSSGMSAAGQHSLQQQEYHGQRHQPHPQLQQQQEQQQHFDQQQQQHGSLSESPQTISPSHHTNFHNVDPQSRFVSTSQFGQVLSTGLPTHSLPGSSRSGTSSSKAPRARVNMACIHCRSRKIRCDGTQPSCSTCTRLGRLCNYENVSEEENASVRDKKKRSREAKQNRLEALSRLGVAMPRQQMGMPSFLETQRRRSLGSGISGLPAAAAMAGPSVLRDSRLTTLAMHERPTPYPVGRPTGNVVAPPQLPAPVIAQSPQQQQQRPQQRFWHGQTPIAPYDTAPYAAPTTGYTAMHANRRRAGTAGSYEEQRDHQNSHVAAWRGRMATAMASEPNDMQRTGMYDGFGPPVMSLSQPATPEAAYQLHASLLSYDLAASNAGSTAQSPYDSSFYDSYFPSDRLSSTVGAFSLGSPSMTDVGSMSDTSLSARNPLAGHSTSANLSPKQSPVGLGMYGPPALHESAATGPLLSRQGVPGQVPSTSSSNKHRAPDNPLVEGSRRGSFDQSQAWHRTNNSDAAIARFFARVVAAREMEPNASSGGSYNSSVTDGNGVLPQYALPDLSSHLVPVSRQHDVHHSQQSSASPAEWSHVQEILPGNGTETFDGSHASGMNQGYSHRGSLSGVSSTGPSSPWRLASERAARGSTSSEMGPPTFGSQNSRAESAMMPVQEMPPSLRLENMPSHEQQSMRGDHFTKHRANNADNTPGSTAGSATMLSPFAPPYLSPALLGNEPYPEGKGRSEDELLASSGYGCLASMSGLSSTMLSMSSFESDDDHGRSARQHPFRRQG